MPYTIANLSSLKNLSESDVKLTLESAGLSLEVLEYSEEEIQKFDKIRELLNSGQVENYKEAKEVFIALSKDRSSKNCLSKNGTTPNKKQRSQKSKEGSDNNDLNNQLHKSNSTNTSEGTQNNKATLSITDMTSYVKEALNITLSLKQTVNILEKAGLADKELYTRSEANKFLITCSLLNSDNSDINSQIQDLTLAMERGLIGLVDEVTATRSKEVPNLVKQLYLQNVVASLAENQDDIEAFFNQIKEGIIKGIEGKSPLRSILQVDWIATPSSESNNLLKELPAVSENTTNTDLTN